MLKKLSLRTRLTLLSALVTASAAVLLSAVFLCSANRIFVQSLPQSLVTIQMSQAKSMEYPVTDDPDNTISFSAKIAADDPLRAEVVSIQSVVARAGSQFNLWGIAGLISIILLGTGAAWLMAGRALKPVRELSATIEEISGKDLSLRVDAHDSQDEIGRLAHSFNGMMDKVSASFERQKRFLASAAHELKTPLATIQVGLDVLDLDEEPSPERMKKALVVTKANTERMIRLVGDLFRLSTDEDYAMDEQVSVSGLFSEILEELSPLIQAKALDASVSAAPGLTLTGNRILLYRALFNLAENAAKYNRDGGVISLAADREEDGVVVCVSDSGIGIPPEDLEHIFEPFYRVDSSRSRAMGGAGLGLSLVQEIVQQHGGSIAVESAPGEGTTFTLRFARAQTGAAPD